MANVTKKLGKAGSPTRDFSTWAAFLSAVGGAGHDLRAGTGTDENYTLEVYNDDNTEFVHNNGDQCIAIAVVTDTTHRLTITAAAGHAWCDNIAPVMDAVTYDPTKGVAVTSDSHRATIFTNGSYPYGFITVKRMQVKGGWGGIDLYQGSGSDPNVIEDCLAVMTNWGRSGFGASGSGSLIRNCYAYVEVGTGEALFSVPYGAELYGCTGVIDGTARGTGIATGATNPASVVKNNAIFNASTPIEPITAGSISCTNNACSGTLDGSYSGSNTDGLAAANQFVDSVALGGWNLALKTGNALSAAGVAAGALTDDAFGTARANPPTIGAQEWAAAPPSGFANPFGLLGVGRAA